MLTNLAGETSDRETMPRCPLNSTEQWAWSRSSRNTRTFLKSESSWPGLSLLSFFSPHLPPHSPTSILFSLHLLHQFFVTQIEGQPSPLYQSLLFLPSPYAPLLPLFFWYSFLSSLLFLFSVHWSIQLLYTVSFAVDYGIYWICCRLWYLYWICCRLWYLYWICCRLQSIQVDLGQQIKVDFERAFSTKGTPVSCQWQTSHYGMYVTVGLS